MRNIIIFLFIVSGLLTACNDVSDVLKPGNNIAISILETQDTVRVVPGDTISFKFMVSTNNGAVRRIEVLANEEIFEPHPEKMTFALIDTDMELSADADGYLSREVSSLIVEYPVYVKENPAILHNPQRVVFRATNHKGNIGENYTYFKGNNFRKTSTSLQFITKSGADELRFFDPYGYKAYSHKSFVNTDSVIPGSEAVKEKIALMFGYTQKLVSMGPPAVLETHAYIFSPASEKAASFMKDTLHVDGYQPEEMKSTLFYHIDGIGGSYLKDSIDVAPDNNAKQALINKRNTLDWDYFDSYINETYLNTLDFSQATDCLELTGGFYAFKTADNLRGVIWINYRNVFDNPLPLTVRRMIFQVIPTE